MRPVWWLLGYLGRCTLGSKGVIDAIAHDVLFAESEDESDGDEHITLLTAAIQYAHADVTCLIKYVAYMFRFSMCKLRELISVCVCVCVYAFCVDCRFFCRG